MAEVARDDNVQIERLELGPWGTNAYVVRCLRTGDSVVVDAPADAPLILQNLKGTNPRYLLLTHNHGDHTGALPEIRRRLRVPLAAHVLDSGTLSPPPEIRLENGDIISFGLIKAAVLHTPGHTAGSLCFRVGRYLLAGDTLFPGGPGKTASPGDFHRIIASITERIFTLPEDTEIFPGHGEATTLLGAKEEYAVFTSRTHVPDLCGDVLWASS